MSSHDSVFSLYPLLSPSCRAELWVPTTEDLGTISKDQENKMEKSRSICKARGQNDCYEYMQRSFAIILCILLQASLTLPDKVRQWQRGTGWGKTEHGKGRNGMWGSRGTENQALHMHSHCLP